MRHNATIEKYNVVALRALEGTDSLTRVELASLKSLFFAPFDGCALTVCRYGGGHHRQNPSQNPCFKVLRSFHERKRP